MYSDSYFFKIFSKDIQFRIKTQKNFLTSVNKRFNMSSISPPGSFLACRAVFSPARNDKQDPGDEFYLRKSDGGVYNHVPRVFSLSCVSTKMYGRETVLGKSLVYINISKSIRRPTKAALSVSAKSISHKVLAIS